MAVTLTLTGKTPGQTQFGLDTFTEHYKCDATADVVLTDPGVPQMLTPHPDYPYMFITNRYCSETSESASALDLVYTGMLGGGHAVTLNDPGVDYAIGDQLGLFAGGGSALVVVDTIGGGGEIETFHVPFNDFTASHTAVPATNLTGGEIGSGATFDVDATPLVLPAKKYTSTAQVASASSNTSSAIYPAVAVNPATVQFYAGSNAVTFISTDPADATEPDDPAAVSTVITWDLGFGLQPGFSQPDLITWLLTQVFTQGIIEVPPDIEPLVPGQFYLITKRKTRTLFPYAPPS